MHDILETDGYKFSMAAAGWPLREETFYYSHRRGGPHYLPFDPTKMVQSLLPSLKPEDIAAARAYLTENGYDLGGGFWSCLTETLDIKGIPKGTWFNDREPVFTVTGPSALVSWLEPLVLQLHYRIQVATTAKLEPERLHMVIGTVTCQEQLDIVKDTLASMGVKAPSIAVDNTSYQDAILFRVEELAQSGIDPTRFFEVGMRAAVCQDQHRLALAAAKEGGLLATSNVYLARELSLKPIGTMGHEHVQRYGDDETAFRAMRDRFPGPSSFLVDTYSTLDSGLPIAFKLIAEDPKRRDSVRFDSGDIESQYLYACQRAKHLGIRPRFILEDGFTTERAKFFESLRELTGIPAEDQLYGFGGYFVRDPNTELTRDRVAAVWKLTQTGITPTMKFGDESGAGKESIPGKPVLYRRLVNHAWVGVVAQEGEKMLTEDRLISNDQLQMGLNFDAREAQHFARRQGDRPLYSPATASLVSQLYRARDERIGSNWTQLLGRFKRSEPCP